MQSHKYISNLSLHVSQHSHNLTAMEKEMIQRLIKERQKFTYKTFTIAHIAEELNVSSTSLHRLTRKLEYPSFAFFKEDYFAKGQEVVKDVATNDFSKRIENTYTLVKQSLQEPMIAQLAKAKRIIIYGMGISSFIGKIYQMKLSLLGMPTEQYDDSRFMRISSQNLDKEHDVIIILSRSGCPPELIEVLSNANDLNVTSLLITEAHDSPLENMATYVIHTDSCVDFDTNIDTRIHTHVAMDMLMHCVIEKKSEGAKDERTI